MNPVTCQSCGKLFTPKQMGYNAQYCAKACKTRAHRARLKVINPEQLVQTRARSYATTKRHRDRYAKHLANARSSAQVVRDWLAAYKLAHGCIDCGYKEHSAALQLDHEGVKSVAISDARSSIARLEAEIKNGQCKVRCANCHSVRTWERKQLARAGKEQS